MSQLSGFSMKVRVLGVVAFLVLLASACGSADRGTASLDSATTEPDSQADARPTSVVATTPPAPGAPTLAPVAIPESLRLGLTPIVDIDLPIALVTRTGSDNIFIATKTGRVMEVSVDADGGSIVRELLDIGLALSSGNEQGLLGLTFSPSGDDLYLDFTGTDGATNVVGFSMDGDEVDHSTARTLLVVDQPRSNHNGGHITFGPDGFLYVGLGDGGGGGDPFQTGQDASSLLGSILRIDPRGEPYAIPPDNPFVDRGGAAEVFVYGVRNPWRFSFDDSTGDLWIADVGQDALEELTVAYASGGAGNGANLGWSDVEGTAPFAASGPPVTAYLGPIYEYGRADGCSVTGGHIYRGSAIAELSGIYIFGDFCTSRIWGFASSESQGAIGRFDLGLAVAENTLASFGEGPDGEIYVLSFEGVVYRIDPR